jgi:hypothetical protein
VSGCIPIEYGMKGDLVHGVLRNCLFSGLFSGFDKIENTVEFAGAVSLAEHTRAKPAGAQLEAKAIAAFTNRANHPTLASAYIDGPNWHVGRVFNENHNCIEGGAVRDA